MSLILPVTELNEAAFTPVYKEIIGPREKWLRALYAILDAHIDNPALNVEWLAGQLAVSRKTLLRKVLALTSLSPNELIRQYRLRKAVSLLHIGYNVTETAYMVGFEAPAYFGKCFKELYKTPPGKFVRSFVGESVL